MKNTLFGYSTLLLCMTGVLLHSCNGQLSVAQRSEEKVSHPIPKVIGVQPEYLPQPGVPPDSMLVSQYIRSIFEDSKGNHWFGTLGQCAVRYDGEVLEYYSEKDFFAGNHHAQEGAGNSVHAITEDHQGHIWFGTEYGVVKYDGERFVNYTEKNGLNHIRIGRHSIEPDKDGAVWVGTSGGVYMYDPAADARGENCFSSFEGIPAVPVSDIMRDQSGNMWVATHTHGVYRYDGKSITTFPLIEGLGDNYAGGIAQDPSGQMWFTLPDGICMHDGKSCQSYTAADGLGGTEIWGMYIETSGIIWVTARGSTTRFDPSLPSTDKNAFRVFTPADGLNCCVQSMYQDRSGKMWFGAGDGLFRFDGTKFYKVRRDGPW